MPEIIFYGIGSPSVEQKRTMIRELTDVVVRNCKVAADTVTINIVELTGENTARGGLMFSDTRFKA